MRSPGEHPSHFAKDEPPSLNEVATFGIEAVIRDPVSGRIFELGSGSHPIHIQKLLYAAEQQKGSRLSQMEAQVIIQAAAKAPA